MATVFLWSPTNSTLFTTCCEVAITDRQDCCPKCGDEVEPKTGIERCNLAYGVIKGGKGYGNHYPNHGK